jgi:FKBP-type peptidyl-prolyl cis-trans isomerase SlyD
MQIVKNTVVTLDFQVFDPDGNMLDDGRNPLVYLHGGYDGIFPRLEEALEGRNQGESFEIKLEPDDAFGEYDEELVRIEPLSLFPENIEVGMQFERGGEGEDDDDGVLYTITDIADGKVVVDGNHPLAGISLQFKVTVAEVRPATEEELSHGHVHGVGGHHH